MTETTIAGEIRTEHPEDDSPAQHGLVEHSHGAGVPQQSRAERATSFDVADFPMPTGREEDWRFTPIRSLRDLLAENASDDGALVVDVQAPDGVVVGTLAPGEKPRGSALVPGDRAAAVASALTQEAVHIQVPAEADLAEPVRVDLRGTAGLRSNSHLVIDVGQFARATILLEHSGSGQHTGNVEIVVGDGADVRVVSSQGWADDAVQLGQHSALIGRDASFQHLVVTLGGKLVRLSTDVHYAGPGGSATLLGVYLADAGQHLEHRCFVDHDAPHCTSRVTYKGALQGETAQSVWVGDVLIRKEAEGTDTYELNRNLLLTDGARADSVPNLEIETGEIVGAGHASATGRFDDAQLFYLQSRGIPADQARRLVVRGFFAEIVAQITIPEVRERLLAAIDAELELAGV